MRTRADGRRTRKAKPGPKPKGVADSDDRNVLIFVHALALFPKLKTSFRGVEEHGAVNRQLARLAIAIIEGEPIEGRAGAFVPTEKLNAAADLLLKKYRAILRDRSRADERHMLEGQARNLYLSMLPKRASTSERPVIITPYGLQGARAWATKRATKAAAVEAVRGESPWVTAARLGALYQAEADVESGKIARRAFEELKGGGFPIEEVLRRLELVQRYDFK